MTQGNIINNTKLHFQALLELLGAKQGEYQGSAGGDGLANFKLAAALKGEEPESALVGMWLKHVVSICEFTQRLEDGFHTQPSMWEEKVYDAINYLFLLLNLLEERYGSRFAIEPVDPDE